MGSELSRSSMSDAGLGFRSLVKVVVEVGDDGAGLVGADEVEQVDEVDEVDDVDVAPEEEEAEVVVVVVVEDELCDGFVSFVGVVTSKSADCLRFNLAFLIVHVR